MDAIGISTGSSKGLSTTAQADYRNSQMVPIGSGVTTTQPFSTLNTVVSLRANVACWFRVGGTAAANTAGSDFLPANVTWQVKIPQGAALSFIQNTGPGWVSVTPLANPVYGVLPASAFDWDFTTGALPTGTTFARSTAANYFNSAGLLTSAAAAAARFDYDPISLVARGFLVEPASTNLALWNRDLTNAVWVKTNATAALTQTGIDGTANAASAITASAANGTVLQTFTSASGARALSAYVKRLAGSGTINMTLDGGVTWRAITVTAGWTRIVNVTQTLANPNVGFQITTSGDSIAVDGVQLEALTYSSSVILTTTATVNRTADVANLTPIAWFNAGAGTFWALMDVGTIPPGIGGRVVEINDGTGNNRFDLRALNTIDAFAVVGGTVTWTAQNTIPFPAGNVFKDAVAYQSASPMVQAAQGIVSYGGGSNPTAQPAGINRLTLSGGPLWVRRVTYWNVALSNQQLVTATT